MGVLCLPAHALTDGNGQNITITALHDPVADYAGVISAHDEAILNTRLRAMHHDGLGQMAVITVKSTDGTPIFDAAFEVAQTLQLGDSARDDGVLLLLAIDDRRAQFITGYGIEGRLPDVAASRIIRDELAPSLKAGQYARGIDFAISAVQKRLTQDGAPLKSTKQAKSKKNIDPITLFVMIFIVTMMGGAFIGKTLSRLIGSGALVLFGLMMGFGMGAVLVMVLLLWVLAGFGGASMLTNRRHGYIGESGGGFGGGNGGFSGGGGGFGGGGAGGSW